MMWVVQWIKITSKLWDRKLFVCRSFSCWCLYLCIIGEERRDPRAADRAPHALIQQQHGQHEGQECQEVSRDTHLPLPVCSTSLPPSVHLFLSLLTGSLSPLFPAPLLFPESIFVSSSTFSSLFVPHSPSYTSHKHSKVSLRSRGRCRNQSVCVLLVFSRLCFTKGHFPKLAECAHFHYENVDFGSIQVPHLSAFTTLTRSATLV